MIQNRVAEMLLAQLTPAKRQKAVFHALDEASRKHALRLAPLILRWKMPEKMIPTLETEVLLRLGPAVAPLIAEDPQGEFVAYYVRHLVGRLHGAGVPKETASQIAAHVVARAKDEVRRSRWSPLHTSRLTAID